MLIILILQISQHILVEEGCQCLNTINILPNSLIITKYINKTYQHTNKCLSLKARFQKGDNLNTNRTQRLHNHGC